MRRFYILFLILSMPFYLFAQVNLSNGLVAYYPFNGTFNDASGNGNNGTGMNGVTFGTDQWGNPNNAASFDGVDDWIDVGVPSFTFGHKFSFSFRFKTNVSRHQVLLSKSDYLVAPLNLQFEVAFNHPVYTPKGIYLATDHNGTCAFGPSMDMDHFGITTDTIEANKWNCIVIIFDNGLKSIYLNGVLKYQAMVAVGSHPTTIDSCVNSKFRMGSWWQGDPRYFSGLLDEVRLYNRALNTQEIDSMCKLIVKPPSAPIINRYAAIKSGSPCGNSFVVDSAQGFAAGDTVLMIQMKGASIDSTNTVAFGTLNNYKGAGNYEKNIIKSVSGNTIDLLYKVQRNYDIPQGKVQFVRVPFYKSYTISSAQTCTPWNGEKGGIYAINVANILTLSDNIDVSGTGFKGGIGNSKVYSTKQNCGFPDFYTPPNIDSSAQKGEGIVNLSISKSYARGPAANGGGGGNATNAGGGGGSNGGAGGIGGIEYGECTTSTVNTSGGIGGLGLAITNTTNKIFLGGGGGAGQANDYSNADGGIGGGIIFIQANTISSSNKSIISNGLNGAVCIPNTSDAFACDDGMGGGGAGGTVVIDCPNYIGGVKVISNGGNGANVTGISPYPFVIHGPGGGGGGGVLWVSPTSLPTAITYTANGGLNGVNATRSNDPRGAKPGNSGLNVSNLKILDPIDSFKLNPLNIDFAYKAVGCFTIQFLPTLSGAITSYNWLFGSVGSSTQQSPIQLFPGVGTYSVTLTVTDSNGCQYSITKPVRIDIYVGFNSDSTICSGQSIQLNVLSGTTFSWTPGTGLSSTSTASVIASPTVSTTYYVTVSDGLGCTFIDTFNVKVVPATVANFTFLPNPPQPNTPIKFQSSGLNGTTWFWDFGDGTYSSEANPSHLYLKSGEFNVCLVMTNDGHCPDTVCQTIQATVKKFVGLPSAFTPNGDNTNDILFVRGAGIASVHLVIFNRWGQKVFETNDINKGWDGTYRGKAQDIDVFAYVVSATFIDGTSETKKGNVNLLR